MQIYDSVFNTTDKETRSTIQNLFEVKSCKSLAINVKSKVEERRVGYLHSIHNSNYFPYKDNKFPSRVNEGSLGGVSEQKHMSSFLCKYDINSI